MTNETFYRLVKFIDKLDAKFKEQLYIILKEQIDPDNLDQQEALLKGDKVLCKGICRVEKDPHLMLDS